MKKTIKIIGAIICLALIGYSAFCTICFTHDLFVDNDKMCIEQIKSDYIVKTLNGWFTSDTNSVIIDE